MQGERILTRLAFRLGLTAYLKKYWGGATLEQVRRVAEKGMGIEDLAKARPDLARKIEIALREGGFIPYDTFLSLLAKANPQLTKEALADPIISTWLYSLWEKAYGKR